VRIAPALLLLLTCFPLAAAGIHKCRDAEGRIAYQDQPCPAESLPLPPIAAPPSVPYLPQLPTAGGGAGAPADAQAPATPPPPPLPAQYRCTRENGESYVSSDPSPPPRYVPAWAVGATSTSSNLPRTPARDAWDRSVGGAYVLVQDRCRSMGRAELCGYWKDRLDSARREARASFFDQREALEGEAVDLRASLRAHCGR
jgi:hypothetical protein